jgi:transposase
MRRTKRVLTDEQWARIAPHLPVHPPSPKGGRPREDDRECLEGILWLLRTGAPWQHITFGPSFGQHLLAQTPGMGWRGRTAGDPRHSDQGTPRTWKVGPRRAARGRHVHPGKKRGDEVGKTKVGKGMKLEVVVDHSEWTAGEARANRPIRVATPLGRVEERRTGHASLNEVAFAGDDCHGSGSDGWPARSYHQQRPHLLGLGARRVHHPCFRAGTLFARIAVLLNPRSENPLRR